MPNPLTPIGFDLPQLASPQIEPPKGLPQPSTTGQAILGQAAAATQQTIQAQSQAYQQEAQVATQTADAQRQSSVAIAQAATLASNAQANRSAKNAQSTAQLTDTLSRMSQQYAERDARQREAEAKRAEEERKQFIAQQKTKAVDRLEKLQAGWIERGYIDTQGSEAYRGAVANAVAEFDLPPEDIMELTKTYYAPGLEYAKKTEENRQKAAAEVVANQKRIDSQKLRNNLSASFGTLAASGNLSEEQAQSAIDNINTSIAEFMKDESIPYPNRLGAVADAFEANGKLLDASNIKAAEINAKALAWREVSTYAAERMQLVATGALPYSQYMADVKQRAVEKGLDSFDVPDPQADQDYQKRYMQSSETIRELSQKRALSAREAITADQQVIGGLAMEATLNPALEAQLRAAAEKGGDTNAKAAIQSLEGFKKFRDETTPQYRDKRAKLNTELLSIKDNFNEWYVQQTKPNAPRSPSVDSFLNQLRSAGIDPGLAATQPARLTPQQLEFVRNSKIELSNAKIEEIRQLDANYKNAFAPFQAVGLSLDVNTMKNNLKATRAALDGYRQQLQDAQTNSTKFEAPGVSPNFNGGAPAKTPQHSLIRKRIGSATLTLPVVGAGAQYVTAPGDGQYYGAARENGRKHGGMDFAVPSGTRAVSLVYGTITKVVPSDEPGYGIRVEVTGDNGFRYLYAHGSSVEVTEGMRVGPGQEIMRTGNTGTGSGPHLHLEVIPLDKNGNELGTVNPMEHLATAKFGGSAKLPRTSGDSGGLAFMPKGSIPLGQDTYILDGKIHKLPPGSKNKSFALAVASAKPANYSTRQPLMNSYASRNASDYPPTPLTANHGYNALARDQQFAKALNTVARNLRIPGQWLADLIAFESAGTFSPGIPNGLGYYGLIQFGPEARQDLGVSLDQLTSMSPAQQMTLVEKYLRLQMRYAGVSQIKGPEWLVAAVNQGNVVLRDVDQRGAAAVLDPQNADGAGTTLKHYMENLGKYSGRRYDYLGNRAQRLSAVIHTHEHENCPVCQSFADANTDFIPHQENA